MSNTNQTLPTSLLTEALNVNKQHWNYIGTAYKIQQGIIDNLFMQQLPLNTDITEVKIKATILNVCYSTHVHAIAKMAQGIVNLNIDSRLNSGDITLVEDISNAANVNKQFLSFASKYCAMHKPMAFPIYDRFVRLFLAKVISNGSLPNFKDSLTAADIKLHNYGYYVKIYNAFMKYYNLSTLTYRQVDCYIWTACKCNLTNLDLLKLI